MGIEPTPVLARSPDPICTPLVHPRLWWTQTSARQGRLLGFVLLHRPDKASSASGLRTNLHAARAPFAVVGLLRGMHIESGECSESSWALSPLRFLRARRIQSARRSCTRDFGGLKPLLARGGCWILYYCLRTRRSRIRGWVLLQHEGFIFEFF